MFDDKIMILDFGFFVAFAEDRIPLFPQISVFGSVVVWNNVILYLLWVFPSAPTVQRYCSPSSLESQAVLIFSKVMTTYHCILGMNDYIISNMADTCIVALCSFIVLGFLTSQSPYFY